MTTSRGGAGVADDVRAEPAAPPVPTRDPELDAVPAAEPAAAKGWGLSLVVLVTGMFMSVLDLSIVNVAIPVIRQDFGVTTESIQWMSTSYSLTEGIVVPISAWLGARVGLKQLYVYALGLFTVASALCGMAGGLVSLVAFRVLQAIPGGVLPVVCLTILFRIVPKAKFGAAMGLYGLGVVLAPAVGPTLGGYLVEHVNWRVIFYINVPVGVLGVIAAMVVLTKFPREQNRPFDLWGFVAIAGALSALLLALEEGSSWGWTSYPVLILLAASVNLLALFVVIELHVEHPLLNVRVFTYWPFVNSLLLMAVTSVGLFAVMFYVPVFLQGSQGLSPAATGLVLLPQALVMVVLMPIAGQLYDRIGARWPAIIGLGMVGGGMLQLSRINPDITRGELILGMVVMSGGLALAMMPIMTSGLSALPPELSEFGSAFNTVVQRASAALGLAVLTAVVTVDRAQFMADRSALLQGSGANVDQRIVAMQQRGEAGLLPLWQQLNVEVQAQAYSNIFVIAGSIALGGMLLALMLKSGRPAEGAEKPMAH